VVDVFHRLAEPRLGYPAAAVVRAAASEAAGARPPQHHQRRNAELPNRHFDCDLLTLNRRQLRSTLRGIKGSRATQEEDSRNVHREGIDSELIAATLLVR
jgi:hypothetical protein